MDLTLVSTDDLVEEMKLRFDTVLVITRKQLDKDTDDICYYFKDKLSCIGLARVFEEGIKNTFIDKMGDVE